MAVHGDDTTAFRTAEGVHLDDPGVPYDLAPRWPRSATLRKTGACTSDVWFLARDKRETVADVAVVGNWLR